MNDTTHPKPLVPYYVNLTLLLYSTGHTSIVPPSAEGLPFGGIRPLVDVAPSPLMIPRPLTSAESSSPHPVIIPGNTHSIFDFHTHLTPDDFDNPSLVRRFCYICWQAKRFSNFRLCSSTEPPLACRRP